MRVVKFREPNDDKRYTVSFTLVRGKWIPVGVDAGK
jgi:hypothetical protein